MPELLDQVQTECLELETQPNHRRNGKIARLPKETRDLLNRMLDDGLPYRVIIDELGEAGNGLNRQNLTNCPARFKPNQAKSRSRTLPHSSPAREHCARFTDPRRVERVSR